MKKIPAIAPLLAILPAMVILIGCRQGPQELVVSGRLERDNSHIGSKIGGRVWRVDFEEGQEVKKGQVIVQLDDRDLKAQLAQAKATLDQAQAQLNLLLAGTRKEDIARGEATVRAQKQELQMREKGFRTQEVRQAEAQLASARSSLALQKTELKQDEELAASGTIAQRDLDTRRTAYKNAQADLQVAEQHYEMYKSGSRPEEIGTARAQLAQAEADLERLKNGPRPEEIEAQRAAVEADKANITRLQTQLDETIIYAPLDATIESLDLKPGDLIKAGDPVAVLNLKTCPYVRSYVPENRLGLVKPGQPVTITVDTFPGEKFPGRIRRVFSEAEFTPRNVQTTEKRAEQVFEMKVDVLEGCDRLREGMYADIHVQDVQEAAKR